MPVPAEEVLAPEEEVQVPAVQEDPEALAAPEVLVLALADPAGQADPVPEVRVALVPAVLAALVPAVLAAQVPEVLEGQVPAVPVGLVVLVALGSALPAAPQVGRLLGLAHLFLRRLLLPSPTPNPPCTDAPESSGRPRGSSDRTLCRASRPPSGR